MQPSRDISRLIEIMAALRNPDGGCPWDLEQDFRSIRHYTIEEAYEVADAIEREDYDELREELGDLLLQPVYHAQLASERGLFDIGDVIEAITGKLIRRHPHVFGEDAATGAGGAKARPALARAEKLSKRAATVNFDWPDWPTTFAKVEEELAEVRAAAEAGVRGKVEEEIGDLLFAVANLARKLDVDPEAALRDAN